MDGKDCESCRHFVQHFAVYKGKCIKVYCGHCIYPRIKERKPDTLACKHYKEKAEEEHC